MDIGDARYSLLVVSFRCWVYPDSMFPFFCSNLPASLESMRYLGDLIFCQDTLCRQLSFAMWRFRC